MTKVPTAKEFMATSLVTLDCEMDIYAAIKVLLKHKISGAPVVTKERELCGVLSEKDCLRLFANGAFNQLPGGKVDDYMAHEVITVSPEDDLFKVAELFLKNPFRRLPVVDKGKLIGQVSRRDVLKGSRKIWEEPTPRPWTDSKYFPDQVKAALKSNEL